MPLEYNKTASCHCESVVAEWESTLRSSRLEPHHHIPFTDILKKFLLAGLTSQQRRPLAYSKPPSGF